MSVGESNNRAYSLHVLIIEWQLCFDHPLLAFGLGDFETHFEIYALVPGSSFPASMLSNLITLASINI